MEKRCQGEDGKEKIEHTSVKETDKGTKKTTYKNESRIDAPIGESTFFMVAAWPASFHVIKWKCAFPDALCWKWECFFC